VGCNANKRRRRRKEEEEEEGRTRYATFSK
jgi:hypothetical protein